MIMIEVEETFKDKYYRFMNKVALEDGAWRKQYIILIILTGLLIGSFITNWNSVVLTDPTTWTEVGFFITAYCLGVPCVVFLSDRAGMSGNILGIMSNIGEMLIYFYFGTFGMLFAGAYFGITHIVGIVRWNDLYLTTLIWISGKTQGNRIGAWADEKIVKAKTYTDNTGKVKIGLMNKWHTAFTILFIIAGLVALVFFGDVFGFERGAGTLGLLVWLGNLLTFVISVTAQFLMIVGLKESWTFWFSSNFVNFFLNLTAGNFWFMIRDVLYQVNAWLAMYNWGVVAYYDTPVNERPRVAPQNIRVLEWDKKVKELERTAS